MKGGSWGLRGGHWGGGSGPYLSHAGLPDVGGVERQRPVAIDLLWGWRRGEVSPRGPPGDGVPPLEAPPGPTFRRAAPLLQRQDGLGGDEEGQSARLEQGQPGDQRGRLHPAARGRGPSGVGGAVPYLMPTVVWMRVVMPTQVKMVPMR